MIKSAGIVVIRFSSGRPLFLLLRIWKYWEFPKGRVENNENCLMTAIRETYEEASIKEEELNFKWGLDSYITSPYNGYQGKKIAEYFIAETARKFIELPISKELGKPEHDEFRWVHYEEGQRLTNYRIGNVLKWAHNKIQDKKK
jgi:bis(5'-nucleosidyl)-tetraphosphatase